MHAAKALSDNRPGLCLLIGVGLIQVDRCIPRVGPKMSYTYLLVIMSMHRRYESYEKKIFVGRPAFLQIGH
jgi:hypothetical protein